MDNHELDKSDFYNGNIRLKKAGVDMPISLVQAKEIAKCKRNWRYFIENYCLISDLDHGVVKFKLFPFQARALKKIVKNRFVLMRWSRQQGKTTSVAAILLWYLIFNGEDKYEVAIVANKREQAREVMSRLQMMYENLPLWMQPGVRTWNKGDIELGNGAKAFTAATKGSGIRGRSVNFLYADEFAFVDNDVEFYTATYPVISSGTTTKFVISSTPKGMNLFYKLYKEAKEKKNKFIIDDSIWSDHPRRGKRWFAEQKANMSERAFRQEYCAEFFGSSDTLISGDKLQVLSFTNPTQTLTLNHRNDFEIFEAPAPDKSYVMTVDVSHGIGKDYSVVNVIDVTSAPYKQVALYRNNLVIPLVLASVVDRIGRSYNDAVAIIETNDAGRQTADSLWYDYEYENMLITQPRRSESVIVSGGSQSEIGVRTTRSTKKLGCSALKGLIESDQLIVQSFETVQELTTFVSKGASFEAEKGKTDDIVMTLVMFAWFTTQPYFEDMTDVNVRALVRDNMSVQDDSAVMGFFDGGDEDDEYSDESLSLLM